MSKLWKVVLTGGPCAGKTTALSLIAERFSNSMAVICIPEMATLTFSSGVPIRPDLYSHDQLVHFAAEFTR